MQYPPDEFGYSDLQSRKNESGYEVFLRVNYLDENTCLERANTTVVSGPCDAESIDQHWYDEHTPHNRDVRS